MEFEKGWLSKWSEQGTFSEDINHQYFSVFLLEKV
jgi:hypothetical protein